MNMTEETHKQIVDEIYRIDTDLSKMISDIGRIFVSLNEGEGDPDSLNNLISVLDRLHSALEDLRRAYVEHMIHGRTLGFYREASE